MSSVSCHAHPLTTIGPAVEGFSVWRCRCSNRAVVLTCLNRRQWITACRVGIDDTVSSYVVHNAAFATDDDGGGESTRRKIGLVQKIGFFYKPVSNRF
jgi:hypothetical protein